VHAAALHLLPVLAAEKSKLAFYIAGGLLAAWAIVISLGIGLRLPDFPRGLGGQRVVMAISIVLVAGAISTAVITASPPAKAGEATSTSSAAGATPAPAGASTTLTLAADPSGNLRYDKQALSAPAGKVTIDFTDQSSVAHNVVVAQGANTLGSTPVQTGKSTLTLDLKPGTYTFYCAVPGHRQAGMQGTLTIS
jgi:plastocyanin